MKSKLNIPRITTLIATLMAVLFMLPADASAHCDTMNGPVVLDAKAGLENGDVTPVLKWITEDDEAEVKAAFERTLAVRGTSAQVREMADMYFFETVVRLHRLSEGVGYTGLKPATSVDPAIAAADEALATANVDALADLLIGHLRHAIEARFAEAAEARAHADHNVEAGRAFVAEYVRFTHLAEEVTAAIHHSMEAGHASADASSHAH